MMADIAKIKRNIQRMIDQNAPESDIDEYVASEGITPEILRGEPQAVPQEPSASAGWSMGNEAVDFLTGGLSNKMNAAGAGVIDATLNAIQGGDFNYSDAYNKHLAFQRKMQGDYEAESPLKAAIGKGAGLVLGVTSMPVWGKGIQGAAGTGAGYGAVMGAGDDANSLTERAANTIAGGITGGLIGAGGYGGGKLLGVGAEKLGRDWSAIGAPADVKANTLIGGLLDKQYGPNNSMSAARAMNTLGPDAALVDVLGERGLSAARGAANIDPMARETLEAFVLGRKSSQNQRVVADIQNAAGVKPGSRETVEGMKKSANDQARPAINAAYKAANKAGYDVPLDYFADVINSDAGGKAFAQAFKNVADRAATGKDVEGNLAVIDETKRILDGWAKQGYRNSDPQASVFADMAKHLRFQMDDLLQNKEYLTARMMRQKAYRADEAFDLGEELGRGRVPLDLPQKAAKIDPSLRDNIGKAYAQTKVETLLNRGSTEGALNELSTPMGQEALTAALGKKSSDVVKALSREKTFNRTARGVTGNSTTARQLAEMGGTAVGGAATATALGYDAYTSGTAGIIAALAKKGAPALTRKLATDAQRKAAPIIAEILTKNRIPVSSLKQLPPSALEKMSKADQNKLVRALLMISESGSKSNPQTVEANR